MESKKTDLQLISQFQKEFPLCSRPFLSISKSLNMSEDEVRMRFVKMQEDGLISRVGPVFTTSRVGKSFLAAVKCPVERIEEVAEIINSYREVNHNYLRENELNIWFVMTAENENVLNNKCQELENKIRLTIHKFPMKKSFKIDLSLKGVI